MSNMLNFTLNSTKNSSAPQPFGEEFTPWKISDGLKICLYLFYSLVFTVGVLGNGLVCYVLGIKKKRKNSGDIFVISLAITDFLASVFVPLVMINDIVGDFRVWYLGKTGCYVLPSVSPLTLTASSWFLVLISLDHYRIIARPFRLKLKTHVTAFGIISVWIIAIGLNLKFALSHRLLNGECFVYASGFETAEEVITYVAIWMTVMTLFPLILMATIYIATAIKLNGNRIAYAIANNRALLYRVKENKRVVKMFLIIVTMFFLLTTPYSVYYFTFIYLSSTRRDQIDIKVLLSWNYGLFVVSIANCCVNPIIYVKFHRDVRRQIKRFGRPTRNRFSSYLSSVRWSSSTSYAVSTVASSKTSTGACHGTINFACDKIL